MNLVALTPCTIDYYPQFDKSYMGGNSLNIASQWKKLIPKAKVSVITCLGNDKNGETIFNYMSKIGLDISRVYRKDGTTAHNQLRVDDTGERFGIEGTWHGGLYEDFYLSESDWAFVAKQELVAIPGNNPNFSEMLGRKHNQQLLAVDYLDIENEVPIEESIDKTDIAFITARIELLDKYKELAFARNKLLIVTLGADGSYAFHNGKSFYQAAVEIPKVIDTTGCGDAYQAAFTIEYFQCRNIKNAMYAGALAASKIAQAYGGVGSI